jgi:iron complex transport system substrate-binding protein
MRRIALLTALLLAIAACNGDETGATTTLPEASSSTTVGGTTTTASVPSTTEVESFPVTVTDATGEVTIEAEPHSIVSLSSTATEMLFAIGAGDQVVAVDEFSTYPEEAPRTDLSGFTPNLEAIIGYQPDLVVISFDPGELQSGLETVGVPSLLLPTALSLGDSYTQIEVLGAATGHIGEAAEVVGQMRRDIVSAVAGADIPDGISFYHEVDGTLYSTTSSSFLGQIYALLGLENIADAADDGSGFPQLASEYIVAADPDLIFLGDVDFGVTPESLSERPGWEGMTAVQNQAIVGLDSYLASNWGPRVVELVELIADAVSELTPVR